LSKFSELGLSNEVLGVLEKLGFEQPTPIQEKAIPILLKESSDFIGLAQTGTGKTAAFGLPLVDLIDADSSAPQALIMAPTRELGQQTAQQLVQFSQGIKKLNVEVVYGGAAIVNQIRALKKPTQIVVATPGRLLDLIKRRAIRLDQVSYVVLDEADEMLNMGFKEDIDEILSHTMEDRVTWLFSATMPAEIRRIVKKYMTNPKEVSVVTENKTNKDITHQYVVTKASNKVAAVRRFMDIDPEMRGVMFCRTKRETQGIADELGHLGYGVEALHGDLSQAQRDTVMRRFKTRSMQLLVATDVAARGIDVNDLTHVIHHTLPDQLESYTHRSGRTARAGKKGTSLALINSRETRKLTDIERKNDIKFEKIEIPSSDSLRSSRINNWANLIIETKVDKQADEILASVQERFTELSKEDILKRLITTQLDNLSEAGADGKDLNEASSFKERGARNSGTTNRYFVNLGTIDGVTQADLAHFLSDVSGIDREHFSDFSVQKNCAFFDVKKTHDKDLESRFQGIEVDGRKVRVNADDDKPQRSRPSGNFKNRFGAKKRSSGGGSGYGGGGGGGYRGGSGGGGSSAPRKKRY
jgi:ATP-dependent RNA helicase DeaD